MMRAARKELGMATSETIMIGDTMETDILGGVQMGYRTILVLTGGTKREDLAAVRLPARHDRRLDRRPLRPDRCLLHDVLPTMNREDDTPHDMREWVAAHS